jgi:D-alanyl-D-alanine carboxypeptidase (penicillin-binding protein 5/6)
MFDMIHEQNAAIAGFWPNEEVEALDLLHGLMMKSGAECAVGLAERVAGTEKAFVALMNRKAKELGLEGTNFVNTTGLHDEEHYSTAEDMAAIFRRALGNETFAALITTERHTTKPTNFHPEGLTFKSSLFSKIEKGFEGGSILGGKTGYTDEAGQCLASLAEKSGRKLILVTSGAPYRLIGNSAHIDDAYRVYGAAIPGSALIWNFCFY